MSRHWIRRAATVTEMTLRDLIRRRAVLGMLFIIPLTFYLGRRGDFTGQAIRFLLLGLGFTASTASMFATSASRSLDPRLCLSGYRVSDLYVGRLVALVIVGLVIAVPYVGVVAVDQDVERLGAIALAMGLTALVAAPLGMALGAVMPRELEGALLLIAVVGAQMLVDPVKSSAKAMPFWSAREIGTYAIDMADSGYLYRGLAHAAGYAAVLFLFTATISVLRLRNHLTPAATDRSGAAVSG